MMQWFSNLCSGLGFGYTVAATIAILIAHDGQPLLMRGCALALLAIVFLLNALYWQERAPNSQANAAGALPMNAAYVQKGADVNAVAQACEDLEREGWQIVAVYPSSLAGESTMHMTVLRVRILARKETP